MNPKEETTFLWAAVYACFGIFWLCTGIFYAYFSFGNASWKALTAVAWSSTFVTMLYSRTTPKPKPNAFMIKYKSYILPGAGILMVSILLICALLRGTQYQRMFIGLFLCGVSLYVVWLHIERLIHLFKEVA